MKGLSWSVWVGFVGVWFRGFIRCLVCVVVRGPGTSWRFPADGLIKKWLGFGQSNGLGSEFWVGIRIDQLRAILDISYGFSI